MHARTDVADGGAKTTPSCVTTKHARAIVKMWYGPTADGSAPDRQIHVGMGLFPSQGTADRLLAYIGLVDYYAQSANTTGFVTTQSSTGCSWCPAWVTARVPGRRALRGREHAAAWADTVL
jgi:hypothetical protein